MSRGYVGGRPRECTASYLWIDRRLCWSFATLCPYTGVKPIDLTRIVDLSTRISLVHDKVTETHNHVPY